MCNLMTKTVLLILTILTFGFRTPKKETIFIITVDTENKNDTRGFFFEFRIGNSVIAKGDTQKGGKFQVAVTTDKEFDIYCRHMAGEDFYVQTIKPTDKDRVKLDFIFPAIYRNLANEVICPKCNKHDQTIPILYRGQGREELFELIDSSGSKTFVPYDSKNYYAGCRFSSYNPEYFCKRDKIKF